MERDTVPSAGPAFAGHVFANPALLTQALTHRSAGAPHNERLEFLGDAILDTIISEALYARWPGANEGALTRARAILVRQPTLALLARTLKLGEHLKLGPGALKTGGHRLDSILADTLEALIAAIYLDAGFDTCRTRVLPWFAELIEKTPAHKVGKDAKTRLQEWLQARHLPRPVYSLLNDSGPSHAKQFHVACEIETLGARAEASSPGRRIAEQQAAEEVLKWLLEHRASIRPKPKPAGEQVI